MKAEIDDNTAIYAQDDTPNSETQYRTRFYFNPNNITMAGGDILDIFTGRNASSDVLRIQLQKNGAVYQIRAGLLPDGTSTWTDTIWYDVPNTWSAVEIQYQAFAYSGSLTLWLDDIQKLPLLTPIDNDTRTLTDIRLGAQGVDTNTSGTLYFDDFESRRFSYIGTLTDPGVDDPQASNPAGWTASTYGYSATIPHAVTSIAIESGGTNTYTYDANGNMTCRIENGAVYTHAYNAENRASSIAKRNTNCTGTIIESWSFAYDGDGTRVMTAHFTGTSGTPDSTTSYYMGGAYEVKDSAVKKYYSIAGMMVAVNDGTAVQYLLTDHLGSTVAVTNASGTLTSQQRYLPFGGARSIPNSPILGTDFGYTGQRMLDSGMGGIMDYKARFYSPYINRFLQPDSIIPNPANPQSLNRLGYVLNNPIRFNDPSGHVCSDPEDPNPTCDGSAGQVTRVGNRMIRGSGHGGNSRANQDCDTDDNGYDDIPCLSRGKVRRQIIARGTSSSCPDDFNLTECFYAQGYLVMGEDPIDIDPGEFESLLLAIAYDLHGRPPGELVVIANVYDTPFYDHSIAGFFKQPGVGCIKDKCYPRDEINYVAQGQLWSAVGVTKETGHKIVDLWKSIAPWRNKSQGTYEMFDFGYDYYQNLYPSTP